MSIPRLPPAAAPLTVSLEIIEPDLPYFEWWYQRTRQSGDTPEIFALRNLKDQAKSEYSRFEYDKQSTALLEDIAVFMDE